MTLHAADGPRPSLDIDAVLKHETDYGGVRAIRGFRWGFFLSLLLWSMLGTALHLLLGGEAANSEPLAQALPSATRSANCGAIPMPPSRYDHPATIRLFVRHLRFGLVDRECRHHGIQVPIMFAAQSGGGLGALLSNATEDGFHMQACSWTYGGIGFVILPQADANGVTNEWDACALRHEVAHINGWPASHPDAHYEGAIFN